MCFFAADRRRENFYLLGTSFIWIFDFSNPKMFIFSGWEFFRFSPPQLFWKFEKSWGWEHFFWFPPTPRVQPPKKTLIGSSVFYFTRTGKIFYPSKVRRIKILPGRRPVDKHFTRFGMVLPGNRCEMAKILPVLKTKKKHCFRPRSKSISSF